ncbi:DUF6270 domain-containing protein [Alcaligenes faecalis]|uniref:DUF6270 domain-containing protein n=1 Tax=Alcaligenes faecalis TaxID=511 RepID=UPI0006C713DC|nr:DUF6270 domain-containing protein [Alcaligenes faecalis]MCX5595072.1 DUF6270 domain-containing protein [Alcaligenes faecalis]QQC33725.1 hypothetical protein I6H81_06100 [Alcaligenes faecalis]CAJ0910230.1 protein of unknown function [Alcaligenes faecalis subsp. faecalis]CUI73311.1 Uncharacterised protein [Alcaligenes faecalis]GAU73892.1 heparinase ii iii family protein [Alcaligenes faecalis subsp. faecalis NBRC 13111]
MEFFIYGGCASRDAFSLADSFLSAPDKKILKYFSRTVPASFSQTGFSIDLKFNHNFHKRLFEEDSKKIFFNFLCTDLADNQFLILDFASAVRLNLYNVLGKIGTLTPQTKAAFIDCSIKYKTIPCWSDEFVFHHNLGMVHFQKFLKRNYRRVILNKLYFSNHCSDGSFLDVDVAVYNDRLNFIYDTIIDFFPLENVIDFGADLLVCDINHKWGVDVFHFTEDYYRYFDYRLSKVCSF